MRYKIVKATAKITSPTGKVVDRPGYLYYDSTSGTWGVKVSDKSSMINKYAVEIKANDMTYCIKDGADVDQLPEE